MTTAEPAELIGFAGRTLRRVPGARPAIGTDRSDMLTITAPPQATPESLRRLVAQHYPAVARWVDHGAACDAWAPIAKELVPGEGFVMNGHNHRLRFDREAGHRRAQFVRSGRWLLVDPALREDPQAVAEAITQAYAHHTAERLHTAAERLHTAAERLWPRLGLPRAPTVRTSGIERTWIAARAGKTGVTLDAHWALSQFGGAVLDYLTARTLSARPDVRVSLETLVPCPEQPRRRMHAEAREVWTGALTH